MNGERAEAVCADVLRVLSAAGRTGVVRLKEIDEFDASLGDVAALVGSLRSHPEGRHRLRLAAALEGVARGIEDASGEACLYPLLGESFSLKRAMQADAPVHALPPAGAKAPSDLKRLARYERVRSWRERLAWSQQSAISLRLRDLDDPSWSSPIAERYFRNSDMKRFRRQKR